MKKTIEKVVKYLIYLTFFVPLIVLPTSFIFPFIVPKILTFRSIVMVMLGCYVLLLLINWKEYKPRFSALNLALAAFFASFTISTFAGVDPYHSFWDNHERMLGLFTVFHYITYYFICSSVLKTWDNWKNALRVFLFAGSAAMFVGILQVFNPNLLLNGGSARVASTLGNSIYVGGYGLFLTFVAFLLIIKEKIAAWRWVYGVLGVLAILCMFFSGTRGSMLGLLVGIAVIIVGYAVVLKDRPKIRKSLWIIAVVGLVLLGILYAFRKTNFVSNIPAVGRTINTSLSDVQNSPRWIAWQIAVESWVEKPIFGWGPNNYFYTFNQHYHPKSLEFGYGETWFDNAHNIIMNTLAVQGTFGILTYLSMFVLAIWSLIMAYRKGYLNSHILIVGMAFLVAHFVQNVTVFEDPTSYLYFMFWLAMISRMSQKDDPSPAPDKKAVSTGTVATVGVVALLLIFIFNIQPARANMKTLDALKYLTSRPADALELVKTALAFNSPHIDDIRSDIGRTAAQTLGNTSDSRLSTQQAKDLFDVIYPALQENLILHPLDIRNHLTLFQLAQIGYDITKDPSYFMQSGAYLEQALQYSPKRQQIIYNLANFDMQIGKTPEAIALLEGAINSDPKVGESYWRMAYVYRVNMQMDKAKEAIDRAYKNGAQLKDQDLSIIQQILEPLPTSTVKAEKVK
ncbi:MAG: O-antigen ligase family protein [Patescibacteria group bacterium]